MSTLELEQLRRLNASVQFRASLVWRKVNTLAGCEVLLPAQKTLHTIATAIAEERCSAYGEDGPSAEEVLEELEPKVAKMWPEQVELDGQTHYVSRPFFCKDSDVASYFQHLGVRLLTPGDVKDIQPLNVQPSSCPNKPVYGLEAVELQALCSWYRAGILKMVNAMRQLSTTLNYTIRVVERGELNQFKTSLDVGQAVTELRELVRLEHFPPTASGFSSSSNGVNILRQLDLEAAQAQFRGGAAAY